MLKLNSSEKEFENYLITFECNLTLEDVRKKIGIELA